MTTTSRPTKQWREYDIHNDSNVDGSYDGEEETPVDLFGNDQEEEEVSEFTLFWRNNNNNVPLDDKGQHNNGNQDTSKLEQQKVVLKIEGQTDYQHSTGVVVWRGAEVMAEYLQTYPYLVQRKCVLELGSGLGLCGLTAHHLGAKHVTMTDGDMKVLKFLQRNMEANVKKQMPDTSSVECRQLIWGQHESFQQQQQQQQQSLNNHCYNVIMAADCMYLRQSLRPFWETVRALLSDDDGILLFLHVASSTASREEVLEMATEHGFTWSVFDFYPLGGGGDDDDDDKKKSAPVYTFKRKKEAAGN